MNATIASSQVAVSFCTTPAKVSVYRPLNHPREQIHLNNTIINENPALGHPWEALAVINNPK